MFTKTFCAQGLNSSVAITDLLPDPIIVIVKYIQNIYKLNIFSGLVKTYSTKSIGLQTFNRDIDSSNLSYLAC